MIEMSLDDSAVAVAAAGAGAEVVRNMFGGGLSRIDKGEGDFATSADVAAEAAIVRVIRTARPGDTVLGEECGSQGADGALRRWLVDPLCGTLNYAVGSTLVAVNVALQGGAAAVADPFSGEIFYADGETAAVRRDDGGSGSGSGSSDTQLLPSAASGLVDVNLDPPFLHAPGFRAVSLLADPQFVARFRPRVLSTTLALTWVAAGKRAAYVTDGGDLSDSVHFAAGIAVCRAAGCVVTGIDGVPIEAGGGCGLVAAADSETHALLMEMIERQRSRTE
jgi:myo-inositol-1(or 4)-monophosphatase